MYRAAVLALAFAACALPLAAQVITPFSVRYSVNDTGDIAIIGNTVLTCPSSSNCSSAQAGTGSTIDDNDFKMTNVDVDSDSTTFNSSRATLALPSGSSVLFAGLYWGADTSAGSNGTSAPSAAARTQVKFSTPVAAYTTLAGAQIGLSGTRYEAYADVTAAVQAGGNGTYTVANIQAGLGSDRYGGWGLIVVYRSPGQAPRNLTVFDGYAIVSSSQANVNISVSGFTTPPGGQVVTRLGVVSYEGDLGLVGDALKLNSTTMGDTLNPTSNFFNSSMSRVATRLSAKVPDYVNQLGFDADVIDATGVLPNGATSATITLTSSGDVYFPGVVTFATELYAPSIIASKVGTDQSGAPLRPGDFIDYVVTLTNNGQDTAKSVVLTDNIPAGATYVPASLQVVSGANAGAKTDASGDDQAEYDALNNRVVFRLGTGANAINGGTIAVGAATSVRFRVAVAAGLANGSLITNQANIAYAGVSLGGTFASASSSSALSVTTTPVLAASKVAALIADNDANGYPSPGDLLRYHIVVANGGDGNATGVGFTDTPDANTTLVAGSVVSSQGSIVSGNAAVPPVDVALGTIAAGTNATVDFTVSINGLPAGVTRVSNQGTVSSNELPTVSTDDPSVTGSANPTVTLVTGAPLLQASKAASLEIDRDLDGVPSAGDRLSYQVTVRNAGTAASTGILLSDTPGANTTLVAGSVTTSQGLIATGNGAGDTSVSVAIGTLAASGSATISFAVDVASPLPPGVNHVTNQAQVQSTELPVVLSDDPTYPGTTDPTRTSVSSAPLLSASKTAKLATDADGDGVPSPGDTLLYQVTVANSGNGAATSCRFEDYPDNNTTLVAGSVVASRGSIVSGNGGVAPIIADLGTLAGGGDSATISFRVVIASPLPAAVRVVSNQGRVTSSELPAVATDDPSVAGSTDATVTSVTASPEISASKTAVLETDADHDGMPSPGDTLLYTLVVTNSGNLAGSAVVVRDSPDENSPLVVGSVRTSAGSIVTGNTVGDTSVVVDLGTIAGGGTSATVTFSVTIASPLPANVAAVANQAIVEGSNFSTRRSDDPATAALDDPTRTMVSSVVNVDVSKSATVTGHTDAGDEPSPGDTLLYTITLRNSGNQAAAGVELRDIPGVASSLVVGSVHSDAGTVTLGNNGGDTSVEVAVGTIPGGETVTVTFSVVISDPLPAGVTHITNQAEVVGDNFPDEPSDDPSTAAPHDATSTSVTAAPDGIAEKTASLLVDADADGDISPGDTLVYLIRVVNTGNGAATGAYLNDALDPYTSLVVGSVQASQGTIASGNNPGDTHVAVAIGDIPGRGGTFTASFHATIANPLPPGVAGISNQAVGGSNELPLVVTDDPTTANANDPTVTVVDAAPRGTFEKSVKLVGDADADGVPSPGDMLRYRLEITNNGNGGATNVFVSDAPPPHTQLVVGSVQTSQGTIAAGNQSGDATVDVEIGALPGHGTVAVVTFLVTIDNPLPSDVTAISNQAIAGSAELPFVTSDDPATPAANDPTILQVVAAPALTLSKTDSLLDDRDGDGVASPGDTLLYSLQITNNGNANATGVALDDTVDPSLALVVGSVQTTIGAVVRGNVPGDVDLSVNIGTLAGRGGAASVVFRAVIADPLAPGVVAVTNQAIVTSNELPATLSDDPATAAAADPTITLVATIPAGTCEKRVALFHDADADGRASPGDTLLYVVDVENTGNGAATGATMIDVPDANTTLVSGSVHPSQGTVTSGNTPGDTTIGVNIGTVPARHGVFTCSFLVTVDDPLPAGTTSVANQATGSSNELPMIVSDDASTASPDDPTAIAIAAQPRLMAMKSASLLIDADVDGDPSPGDTLRYVVTVTNDGNIAASNVVLTDLPDMNSTLVAGSITTTQGLVLGGNAGTPPVSVDFGTIAGRGGSAVATFEVLVVSPMPAGAGSISNQGLVTCSELPAIMTDDPDTATLNDPTRITLEAAPRISATKASSLHVDADGSGGPSAGDTMRYEIVIHNDGSEDADALAVSVNDLVDAHTAIVAGSVVASQGTVMSGNAPGDTTVSVALGTVPGDQGRATVRFDVVIDSPLPEGVERITNQATVAGSNFPPVNTDDPATPGLGDPTSTALHGAADLRVAKSVLLAVDSDADGVASPGDTLTYVMAVVNVGYRDADGVVIADTPDVNTNLVPGSIRTTAGAILSGNTGVPPIRVEIDHLAARGGEVAISFSVTVADPLPAGVTAVSNQAIVTANNLASTSSDDPGTPAEGDPTVLVVNGAPILTATKAASLVNDLDGNGYAGPGDTLLYTIEITNSGDAIAEAVTFDDTPDANTTIVAGSAWTTAGSIVSGLDGNPPLSVAIGRLAANGASVTIQFEVLIPPSFPPDETQVVNQGSISGSNFAALATDDPATAGMGDATVVTVPTVDIALTKTHPAPFTVGTNGTYSMTATNLGGAAAGSLTLTDPLPVGLTYVSASGSGWSCGVSNGIVTCQHPDPIAVGANSSVELTVAVGSSAFPTVTNHATLSVPGDTNPNNNSSQDPTTVKAGAAATRTPTATGLPTGTPTHSPVATTTPTNSSNSTPVATSTPSVITTATASMTPTATATRTATASATTTPPATTTPTPFLDISLVTSNGGNFRSCARNTYDFRVTNTGTGSRSPTTDPIYIVETLPEGVRFVAPSGDGWTCEPSPTNVVTCVHALSLAPEQTTTLSMSVWADESTFPSVNNVAQVVTAHDNNPNNDTSYDSTTVYRGSCESTPTPAPDHTPAPTPTIAGARIVLRGTRFVVPGYAATLKTKIRHVPAPVSLELALPSGLSAFDMTPPATREETGKLIWELAGVDGYVDRAVTVKVTADPQATAGSELVSTATASFPGGTASSSWTTTVRARIGDGMPSSRPLSIQASGSRTITPGLESRVRIRYRNLSAAPATLRLSLPPELTLKSMTLAGTIEPDGVIEWSDLPAPGYGLQITLAAAPNTVSGDVLPVTATVEDATGLSATATYLTTVR